MHLQPSCTFPSIFMHKWCCSVKYTLDSHYVYNIRGQLCSLSAHFLDYCSKYHKPSTLYVLINELTRFKCCHCHWITEWAQLDSFSSNDKLVLIVRTEGTKNQFSVISFLCIVGQNACASFILSNMVIPDHSVSLVRSWRRPSQEDSS